METVESTAAVTVEEGEINKEGQGQEAGRLLSKIQQGLQKLEQAKGWVLGGGSPGVSIGDVSKLLAVGFMEVFFCLFRGQQQYTSQKKNHQPTHGHVHEAGPVDGCCVCPSSDNLEW